MDPVFLVAVALGVAAVVALLVAVSQWRAHGRAKAALAEALEEIETLRRHDAQLHEAFAIYRDRHNQVTDRVRPRRIDDDQRQNLRMHLRELPGLRVRIRVAADTEPALAAADLASALIAAGASVTFEETDIRLGNSDAGARLEVTDGSRGRLFRAALRAYAFPMVDADLAVVRVKRGGAEDDSPEAIITVGSRRIPPELTDLPPPPAPPPKREAPQAPPPAVGNYGGTGGLEVG